MRRQIVSRILVGRESSLGIIGWRRSMVESVCDVFAQNAIGPVACLEPVPVAGSPDVPIA